MLSILIPTCNFDCSALVEALWLQAEALRKKREGEFDFEIIVSDDASSNRLVLDSLETVARAHQEVHILYQPTRLGRAANRNVLIQQSRMPWLLFIDSDAEVCTPDFIARYWEARHSADVVCGSLRVGEWRKGAELRYRYEKRASTVSAAERRPPDSSTANDPAAASVGTWSPLPGTSTFHLDATRTLIMGSGGKGSKNSRRRQKTLRHQTLRRHTSRPAESARKQCGSITYQSGRTTTPCWYFRSLIRTVKCGS